MITLPVAQERLAPLHEPIVDSYLAAHASWIELLTRSPRLALPLDRTTRANFINDHACHEITHRVEPIEGVKPFEGLGFFALSLDGILLRFKFLGYKGLPSNVRTRQQGLLARQLYNEDMVTALEGGGIPLAPTLLTAAYVLDEDKIGRIEIRRDCRGHLPWKYDIYGGTAVVEPIPLPGMEDEAKPAIVVSKKRMAEEIEADQG